MDAPPSIRPPDAGPGAEGLRRLRSISRTDRRILVVSAATVASRVFYKAAQLVFLVIAARLLSVEEFAGYSYLLVLAVTFSMLADTGVALAASREISAGRRSAAEAFWSSLPVIAAGAALAGVVVLCFGLADSAPGSAGTALVLTCLFVVVNTLFNFAATTLRGVGRSVYEALLQGLGALAFVAGAATALVLGAGLVPVLAILLAKETVCAVLAVGGLWREVRPARRWLPDVWRRLLRIGIQLGVASTALALVTRIPTVVLANSSTSAELAWFSAGQRLADAVLVVATTCGFAVLPSLTLLLQSERPRAWRLLGRLLAAAALAGLIAGVLGTVFARELVTFAFGSDFAPAAGPTRVLMAGAPAYALVGMGWYALVALGLERGLLAVAGGATVLSIGLSLALVPGAGDAGAALAYAASLGLMAAGLLFLVGRTRARE